MGSPLSPESPAGHDLNDDGEATCWGVFSATVLEFKATPPFRIDLRHEVLPSVLERLHGIGFGQSFGVVTAEEPMGASLAPDVNERLVARLRERVQAIDAAQVDVDACGAHGSHCERSIAIAIDIQSVVRLADDYRQLAIFWFDGRAFWIIPVRSNKAKLKLP